MSASNEECQKIYSLQVNGYTLNIQETGEGPGLPLILIHGFGGSINSWFLTQKALAKNRRIIAFDLPGHGASCRNVGEGNLDAFAGILSHMLAELRLPYVHLAGHSLGGGIALNLARLRPDRVASLSLIASAGLGAEVNAAFLHNFIEADDPASMRHVLEELVCAKILIGRKTVDDALNNHKAKGVRQALRYIMAACFDKNRQKQILRSVPETSEIPVQVIWGADDAILPSGQAMGLPARIAVHLFEQTGHMPQLEKASEVNALIRAFLAQTEAEAGAMI